MKFAKGEKREQIHQRKEKLTMEEMKKIIKR
jgi:hypothetical protein